MLVIMWIIWLISTVLDVIHTYQRNGFLWDDLEDSSQAFIILTLIGLFAASFISWISQFIVE